jgi:ribose 5-phosphate isomerase B
MLIASDHGGFELKQVIVAHLTAQGVDITDLGVDGITSVDYPDYAALVAGPVSTGAAEMGILICGTGIGMSIAANKFPGVRAALAHDLFTAQMAREHNNANILVLGGRVIEPELACRIVDIWLHSKFEGGRHQNRLNKIIQLQQHNK